MAKSLVIKQVNDWESFSSLLRGYFHRPQERRDQLWFRGQSEANWSICPTLDQLHTFPNDPARIDAINSLLDEFRCEAIRVGLAFTFLPNGTALELLARHHGLPSPWLDWTESPYIAAYFAFEGALRAKSKKVAIWMLDRAKWPAMTVPIDLVDDVEEVRFNRRALQQRGVFMRVSTIQQTVEQMLGSALIKFEIPSTERNRALDELDEMTIDSTHLFGDLDGAAKTAAIRALR